MPDITENDELDPINARPVKLVAAGAALDLVKDPATDGLKVLVVNPASAAPTTTIRDGDNATLTALLTTARELRVAVTPAPPAPGETAIRHTGSISTASATFVTVTNATALPAEMPAQDAEYTVPAGKKIKITRLDVKRLTPNGNASSGGVTVALLVGGVVKALVSAVDVSSDESEFAPALEFPAGSVIRFAVRRVGGDTHACYFTWQGTEASA